MLRIYFVAFDPVSSAIVVPKTIAKNGRKTFTGYLFVL